MKDTKDYKFKFVFWKEVVNFLLHVVVGGVIAHTFLPYLSIYWIVAVLFFLGAGRELWQQLRGKIQPIWMSTVDAISFSLGGFCWWLIMTAYNINVDFL